MAVSLDSAAFDEFNTAEAKKYHAITDKLSSCGVGKIVNLPQIIVIGEQSAGKSSVLEAISRVRFPVKGNLCTRFATELVLRQAPETRVDVSVRFADKSKPSKGFNRSGFCQDDIPDIIAEAKKCMGISATGRDFSKDVLRLEIEGPSMHPLTLVDLPGLFHVDTADQSMRGKEMVDELVESYMKQKNSILLVVITATNQLANHIALRKVKEHDPQRERTLGVITKPDLARPGYADERTYIQLAKNQESAHKLKRGWHVLRNRAEDEESLDTRDANEEEFFKSSAWSSIPTIDRGVGSLRRKLSKVLFEHIRNSLPSVAEDIQEKLSERQEEMKRLGSSRSTQSERRTFLLNVAGEFQRLARDGIGGAYSDPFFGNLDDREHKFRAQLRNFNRAFDHILTTKGSSLEIAPSESGEDEESVPEFLVNFLKRYPYDFAAPEVISMDKLMEQLQEQAASNQGREFPGSPNKDLVIQLFQKQSAPWKDISKFHVKQVTLLAKVFVDQLFYHIIGPPDTNPTTERILGRCVDPWFAEKELLLSQKLSELLRPYEQGYAMPLDSEFRHIMSDRLQDCLFNRLSEAVDKELVDGRLGKASKEAVLEEVVSSLEGSDAGEFGTEKVIYMMEAYYAMSRRTFTDNIINLAIESCLVREIPEILTPTKVFQMGEEEVTELADEPEDIKSRREQLDKEIKILQEGDKLCRLYQPRGVTVLPTVRLSPVAPATTTSGGLFRTLSSNVTESLVTSTNPTASAKPNYGPLFGSSGGRVSGNTSASTGQFGPNPFTSAFSFNKPLTTDKPENTRGSGLFGARATSPRT